MTILRAVSSLSRPDLRSRGGGAGPSLPTPEANCLGINRVNYGWAPLSLGASCESEKGESHGAVAGVNAHTGSVSQNELESESAVVLDLPQSHITEAYSLAQQYENLAWQTFGPLPLTAKSFLQVENASVKVVATRVVENPESIELRLLNTALSKQSTMLDFSLEHCEAMLTTADGRVIEILNVVKHESIGAGARSKNKAKAKSQEPISCAPDVEECLSQAAYRVDLGPNALVSVRLRLPGTNAGPSKVQGTK